MHRVEIDDQGWALLVRGDGYTGNASRGLSNLLNGSALVAIVGIMLSYVAGAIRSDLRR